ncbi:MAG TPA: hypothetical protein VFP33_01220 [Gallionella sp.]|nr:hypothetical protein [Gallionella sp.]
MAATARSSRNMTAMAELAALVKGSDWKPENIGGSKEVQAGAARCEGGNPVK